LTAITVETPSSEAASSATASMPSPKTAMSMSPPMACAQLTHLAVLMLRAAPSCSAMIRILLISNPCS
jgi:hypothetical protein